MSSNSKKYPSIDLVAKRLRQLITDNSPGSPDYILIFAHNGTGKTRLSMAFKDAGKRRRNRQMRAGDTVGSPLSSQVIQGDTLYFNAYTEDLFHWDNDLENDSERKLKINSESKFFNGFRELALEGKIFKYLERYVNFNFRIDYEKWTVSFYKGESNNFKISRGEENIFIWCIFLAICELTIDGEQPYNWVKYIYIDDPVSSLDENNAISVACDLVKLLKKDSNRKIRSIISTHHSLFYNVICNEIKKESSKRFYFHYSKNLGTYTLQATDDVPFFHHVALLNELKQVIDSGDVKTYHFNIMRSILEKTSSFFNFNDIKKCIHGIEDDELFHRAVQLFSHSSYSIFNPVEMVDDNKELLKRVLYGFLDKYKFELPDLS